MVLSSGLKWTHKTQVVFTVCIGESHAHACVTVSFYGGLYSSPYSWSPSLCQQLRGAVGLTATCHCSTWADSPLGGARQEEVLTGQAARLFLQAAQVHPADVGSGLTKIPEKGKSEVKGKSEGQVHTWVESHVCPGLGPAEATTNMISSCPWFLHSLYDSGH